VLLLLAQKKQEEVGPGVANAIEKMIRFFGRDIMTYLK
jgi:hypothetical protein